MNNHEVIATIDTIDDWLAKLIESLAQQGYHHTLATREEIGASK